MADDPRRVNATWPEALATVLECKYDFGAGRALAFGVPRSEHFRIRYNYYANGALHEGSFYSAQAIPQGSLFPIHYNPDAPHEHQHAGAAMKPANTRRAQLIVGVIGSIVLSLAWLLVLRGCH